MMANQLKRLALRLRNRLSPTNSFRVDRRATFKSEANILRTKIDIRGSSEVVLEDGVRLRNAELLVRGRDNLLIIHEGCKFRGRIELYGDGNAVTIGSNSSICGALLAAHNGCRIDIGMNCLFSDEVELRTTDSHKIFDEQGELLNADGNVCIGDGVWLGRGVAVLKGVSIGDGAVIGMRSVVTRSIEARVLAAGVPARKIRSNIVWKE